MIGINRKTYREIAENIIALIVMVSFAGSMFSPQIVNAQTEKTPVTNLLSPITYHLSSDKPQMTELPVANARQPRKIIWVLATAYTSAIEETDATPCLTSIGHDLCQQYEEQGFGNTIAANFLAYGRQTKIPEFFGGKIFIVRDRMNERYGYGRIDIWMPTKEEAKEFGVKWVEMEIF